MADGFIQLPPDSTGKLIDTSVLTVGANSVNRERDVIADPIDPSGLAKVENTDPASSDYGLVVRVAPSPTGVPIATQDAADGTVGATAPTVAVEVGAVDTVTGDLVPIQSTDGFLNTNAEINTTFIAEANATWDNSTALNAELDSASAGTSVSFTFVQTGTFSAGAVIFEQSEDGSNWAPISLLDNTTNVLVAGYTFVSGVNRVFSTGFSTAVVRARLSVAIVGTGSVFIAQITYAIATPQGYIAALPSTGIAGSPAPSSVTDVGGVDPSGNLQSLQLDSSKNLKVTVVPQVPGNNGVVQPQLVKTDPTTNDLLIQLIMEMRAVRVVLSHLASENGDAQFNDFDPLKWVESDTIQV